MHPILLLIILLFTVITSGVVVYTLTMILGEITILRRTAQQFMFLNKPKTHRQPDDF